MYNLLILIEIVENFFHNFNEFSKKQWINEKLIFILLQIKGTKEVWDKKIMKYKWSSLTNKEAQRMNPQKSIQIIMNRRKLWNYFFQI